MNGFKPTLTKTTLPKYSNQNYPLRGNSYLNSAD